MLSDFLRNLTSKAQVQIYWCFSLHLVQGYVQFIQKQSSKPFYFIIFFNLYICSLLNINAMKIVKIIVGNLSERGRKNLPLNVVFVRTYVSHLLGTYVTILCNWLILLQNTLYLYFGRSRMCLILQETAFQDQVLKTCKSVQDSS